MAGNYKSSAGNFKTAGNFKITPLKLILIMLTLLLKQVLFF